MRKSVLCMSLMLGSVGYSFAGEEPVGAKALFYGEQALPKLAKAPVPVNETAVQVAVQTSTPVLKTSQPIAEQKVTRKNKPVIPANLGLMAWVDMVDDNGHVQRVSSKREFRSGDAIRLNVQTNRAGYLYVVNLGSSGLAKQLFPAEGKSVKVSAGKAYSVPGKGRIRFDSTPGTEEVLMLLSPQPISQMPQLKQTTYSVKQNDGWTKVALTTGAKDLLLEEETEGLQPAVFAVDRTPVTQSGSAVSLRMSLKHN